MLYPIRERAFIDVTELFDKDSSILATDCDGGEDNLLLGTLGIL